MSRPVKRLIENLVCQARTRIFVPPPLERVTFNSAAKPPSTFPTNYFHPIIPNIPRSIPMKISSEEPGTSLERIAGCTGCAR